MKMMSGKTEISIRETEVIGSNNLDDNDEKKITLIDD